MGCIRQQPARAYNNVWNRGDCLDLLDTERKKIAALRPPIMVLNKSPRNKSEGDVMKIIFLMLYPATMLFYLGASAWIIEQKKNAHRLPSVDAQEPKKLQRFYHFERGLSR